MQTRTMRQKFWVPVCVLISTSAQALEPLADDVLAGVSARESVAINLQFSANADLLPNGQVNHLACPTSAQHPLGTPDCRWGLAFNDLDEAWLVVKGYYMAFRLDRVRLSSDRTGAVASGLCNAACAARFSNNSFNPNDMPVLQLGFDHFGVKPLGEAYYGDAMLYLRAERVMAEFDDAGTEGFFLNNVPGAAISIRMADGPNGINGAAQMRLDGRLQIYGY
jgi:hypothetical protein